MFRSLAIVPALALVTAWWVSGMTLAQQPAASGSVIHGTVALDGQPLTEGRILFYLADDQIVGAKITQGKFKVKQIPAGTATVGIEGQGVPGQFAAEDKSPLRVEIAESNNQFDFELSSN